MNVWLIHNHLLKNINSKTQNCERLCDVPQIRPQNSLRHLKRTFNFLIKANSNIEFFLKVCWLSPRNNWSGWTCWISTRFLVHGAAASSVHLTWWHTLFPHGLRRENRGSCLDSHLNFSEKYKGMELKLYENILARNILTSIFSITKDT